MNGTTPPCEMTTSPKSLFSLQNPSAFVLTSECFENHSLLVVTDGEL